MYRSVTVNAGGTLAATSTTTAMTVNGNLVLNTGSDYEVTVTAPPASTARWPTGTSTPVSRASFTVNAGAAGYSGSDTYTVLTTAAANGVSGTFSGLTIASGGTSAISCRT